MTKRIIALLLALILTVGLLPTVALADGPELDSGSTGTTTGGTAQVVANPRQSVEHEVADDPIHITKSVSTDKTTGKNYLTMEAYVTNPLEIKQEAVPIDIVLVLDVSGSMDDPISEGQVPDYEAYQSSKTNDSYYWNRNNVYYKIADDNYVKVNIERTENYELVTSLTYNQLSNGAGNVTYYAQDADGNYHSLRISRPLNDRDSYLYVDGRRVQQVTNWNAQIQLSRYTLYKVDSNNATYTYTRSDTNEVIVTSTGRNGRPTTNGQTVTFYYYNGTTTQSKKKIAALKEAANSFVTNVAAQELSDNQHHRISLVKFSGNMPNPEMKIGNDDYSSSGYRYHYSQIVKNLTEVDGADGSNTATLKTAIDNLDVAGSTRADYGLKQAQNVLNARSETEKKRPSVVIMFTDGEPSSFSEFDSSVASSAVNIAKALKDAGTIVYTIAVVEAIKGADPEAPITGDQAKDINKYLHAVSSNYPKATANSNGNTFNVNFGTRVSSEKNYYFTATNAIGLNNVFETISREVSNLALVVDSTAVLSDTLSDFFVFDGVNAESKTGITVKRIPANDHVDENGKVTWNTSDETDITNKVKINIDGKSITVTGFDYASDTPSERNIVTVHADGSVTGAKLVITFPIKPDDSATWEEGKANYRTNSITNPNEAGLGNYALKTDKDNKNQKTQLTESPEIQIEAHKVTYRVDANGYTGTYTVPAEQVYRTGAEYTIADPLTPAAGSGYKFTGWCTDNTYATEASGKQPMGTTNVTYYGKFEKNEVEVDLASYVKKTLTGNLPTGYSEIFKATISGSPLTDAVTIETDSFNGADTKTFKGIAATKVKLTYGTDYTFNVKEIKPTNGATVGMTYDETEYTLTVKVSDAGAVTTESSNGTGATEVTISNRYSPTSASFDLSGKFQKTLNSNVELSKLPDNAKSFELKIWEGDATTGTLKATGTATIDSLTKNEQTGKYTGSANFNFGSTVLTFTEAKEYTYTVKETVGTVAGMQYDTNTYTLKITVVNNNGKFEVQSATIGSTDMKDSGPLTITNTFKGAELPLDPPAAPATGTGKIVKKLRLTGGTEKTKEAMTFSVTVKDANGTEVAAGTATIPMNSLDEAEASFTGLGTLVFPTADEYTFTIKETAGKINGVDYDSKEYTLNVKVEASENDNSLSVTNTYYRYTNENGDQIEVHSLPVTITNTYTEPKAPSVVSKKVVTTDAQFPNGLDNAIDEFKSTHKIKEVLYPTGDGTTNNTLEVNKGTSSVTLLYAITVNKGTTSNEIRFTDDGATCIFAERATVDKDSTTGEFVVTFNEGMSDAVVYVVKTHSPLNFDNGKCTVENVISEEIKATTTVTEKDPNKLTINFADYVKKELEATGSKTASDVSFTVNVNGYEVTVNSLNEEEVSTYDEPTPTYTATLGAHFDSITGGETKTTSFNGSIQLDHAGYYYFNLSEEDGQRTGVTYDETRYRLTIMVSLDNEKNELYVSEANATRYNADGTWEYIELLDKENGYVRNDNYIIFKNTIDTGIDDYPIIIPTIINKDTGMLNKTDHYAYVIGYPDGTVHPNGQITRAEVATIFFRLLRDEVRDGAFTTSNSYSDVAYGKWYNNPISTMSALGIITGYPDGTFKPDKPITRAEFAAIAARFDETQSGKSATFSDVIGHWAAKEIGIAYYNDWIKGYPDGTFKPDQNITRAEAMTLINRVLERKPESPSDLLSDMNVWTDNMDTSKWYYLDVQEATNSHSYTRKTFNYELWRSMLPDPDWSRYER